MKIDSTFVESNILPEFAWFCLAFRAFSKINSSASWPTVGRGVFQITKTFVNLPAHFWLAKFFLW